MNNKETSNFSKEVKLYFKYLETFNFSIVEDTQNKIRYESENIFFEITHSNNWDGEIAIYFGRLFTSEHFSFSLFLKFINSESEKKLGESIAFNPKEIKKILKILSNALEKEGKSIISGDDEIFDKMKNVKWWDFDPDALK